MSDITGWEVTLDEIEQLRSDAEWAPDILTERMAHAALQRSYSDKILGACSQPRIECARMILNAKGRT